MARLQKIKKRDSAKVAAVTKKLRRKSASPTPEPEPASTPVAPPTKKASLKSLSRLSPRKGKRAEKRRKRLTNLRRSTAFHMPQSESPRVENFTGFSRPAIDSSSKKRKKKNDSSDSDVAGQYFVIQPVEPEHEKYSDWFRRVVIRNRWMTWFTAFYLHWSVLLIMAAVIVHGPENTANLLLNATFADDEPVEPMSVQIETPMPLPQEVTNSEAAESAEPTVVELNERPLELNSDIIDEMAMTETADASMTPSKQAVSESARAVEMRDEVMLITPIEAVSEGSFSVWTEPSQPVAGEPYRIIVQVRLPPDVKSYALSDLQGVVVGSDGYRKPIPGNLRGSLPISNGYARFVVPIVSADEHVSDTVFIRSRLLKESQKLLLQF